MADLMQVSARTVLVAATGTSAAVALPGSADVQGRSLRLHNIGTVLGYWETGGSDVSVTIPTTSVPGGCSLAPGAPESFQIPPGHTHIAFISASGTLNILMTPGQGQ
jgi:hypothetical protein